jgi:hypothetical protein
MDQRLALLTAARGFLGVPFAHQGRSRQGLDCLGLLMLSAEAAGLRIDGRMPQAYDQRTYGHRPDCAYLERMLGMCLRPVSLTHKRPGDVLLLRIEGRAQHLALVSDYPAAGSLGMIHAYAVARKVVEHRLDESWEAAIHGVYSLPTN